jgi:hypothetical protein
VTVKGDPGDPDGANTIVKQEWAVGNGDWSAGDGTKAVTLSWPGPATVRYRVTDDGGEVREASATIAVTNRPPVASIGGPDQVTAGDTLPGAASDPDGDATIVKREWNLGAGWVTVAGDRSPALTVPGIRTVQFRVTDDAGETATASRTVVVAGPPVGVPPDTTPCTVRAGLIVRKLVFVLRHGLRLQLVASERCVITLRIVLSRAVARGTRLSPRATGAVVVGKRSASLKPGTTAMTVKLTRAARRALRRSTRVAFGVRVAAVDGAGNTSSSAATVRVKR